MVVAIDPVVDGGFVKTVEVAYRQLLVQHLKKRIVTAQRCDCSLVRPWSVFEVFVLQLVKTEKIVLPKLRQVGRVESVEKGRKKLFRRLVQDEVGAVCRVSIRCRGGIVRVCHGYNSTLRVSVYERCAVPCPQCTWSRAPRASSGQFQRDRQSREDNITTLLK